MLLEVRNLTKRFGGLTAVSDMSFGLDEGDIVGIFGPNGSGKTTLLNLISGVYEPTAGQLVWQGQELVGRKPHRIAEAGIVKTFQNPQLFGELSVHDNIAIAGHLRLKRQAGWRRIATLLPLRRKASADLEPRI
ncbi:MAG TPA: ATP-binding cassette domain-containing protein, partial [Casimicrobiaceae bacterium]